MGWFYPMGCNRVGSGTVARKLGQIKSPICQTVELALLANLAGCNRRS